jgi:hypothetical protein
LQFRHFEIQGNTPVVRLRRVDIGLQECFPSDSSAVLKAVAYFIFGGVDERHILSITESLLSSRSCRMQSQYDHE